MLVTAWQAFILRNTTFDDYSFPRWQSFLSLIFFGVLFTFDAGTGAAAKYVLSLPMHLLLMQLICWSLFIFSYYFLSWWLKRAERWDQQGDLFNLLVAASFIPTLLSFLVTPLLPLLALPLLVYSFWVNVHAITSAIPRASFSYVTVGMILLYLTYILFFIVLFMLFAVLYTSLSSTIFPPQA